MFAEAFPPSDFLVEELTERGWTREQFAERLGRSITIADGLLENRVRIRPHTAAAIGRAFGTSAKMWMNLERAYDRNGAANRTTTGRGK